MANQRLFPYRVPFVAVIGCSLIPLLATAASTSAADAPAVDYLRDVKPLLQVKCFSCHSARKQEGGLRLDAAKLIREGGDSGPAVVAGAAKDSLLLERIAADDDERMPPESSGPRLTDEEISKLAAWIDAGAIAPDESIPDSPNNHWAFQPPARSEPPNVAAPWIRSELDRFLAAEQNRLGVTAVGEVSRSLLLRRVYLDLIGLPPTRDELLAFLEDTSPNAYEQAVGRLLEDPRYGERWARHFMDIWRYSDPSGYGKEIRDGRQHLWRWRDWIVDSLNADKGYDRMVVEMLAADEVAPGDHDALRATGFLARNWYKFNRNVWLDNIVEHSSKAFLGLTINCARCHEHKYDPFEQVDYYRLRAIFETHDVRDDPLTAPSELLVRTYDAHMTRPTYLFTQGDENRPDKEAKLSPGLPELFGDIHVTPVKLPVDAWYPALRVDARQSAAQAAKAKLAKAEAKIAAARVDVETARDALANYKPATKDAKNDDKTAVLPSRPAAPSAVIQDDFATLNKDHWKVENGRWTAADGRIVQSVGATAQHRLVSRDEHPRDFRIRIRLRITGGKQYQSVGVGFDVHDKAMHAVYLSVAGRKVQYTAQNASGSWQYPATGAASHDIIRNKDYELELSVKDQLLNVSIDGQHKVAFRLPGDRRPGKIALWTFSATAEFDQLDLWQLPGNTVLRPAGATDSTTARKPPSKQDLEGSLNVATAKLVLAKAALATASAEQTSLFARTDAELVKHGLRQGDWDELAVLACRADRQSAVNRLEEQVAASQVQLAELERPASAADSKEKLENVKKQLADRSKELTAAKKKLAEEGNTYSPLGPTYPQTSSGRRLAYARWITRPENPLTARVLVNHVWLRHFGAPLVERTFDFGLRSNEPRHLALLDWLANQFVDDGWSLKRLHQRIVTSGAYRRSTRRADASRESQKRDPDNLTVWRMNARRMDAEVVRDSLLYLGGSLDATTGGPPIEHTRGQDVPRRSLYFRQDKERQMTFLSLFDGAKVNECYERKATVAPQQALALFNSRVAAQQAEKLSRTHNALQAEQYVTVLFEHVLCREPTEKEQSECTSYLSAFEDGANARVQLALVLLNHNDFVTIR